MNEMKVYDIGDIFRILLRWKYHIAVIIGISIVAGLVLAFSVTRYYKSTAALLPPKEQGMLGLSGLSSVMKSLPSGLGKFAGGGEDNYDYIAILRSRTVIEDVVNRFNLLDVYEIEDRSMEKAIKAFKANSEVEWADGDVFEIRVWDVDPNRAAEITNYLVDVLNKRSYELHSQEAHNNRVFIETRVLQNKQDLRRAEEDLKKYQEETGTVIVVESSTQGFSSVAEMYGMKAIKEIELEVLRKTVGKDNPEYRQKYIELAAIEEKIQKLPQLGLTSFRLYREVAIQQKIMEFIIPLYEEAKINEHKDIPVAYVLDKGVPGERPDRPKRLFVAGISLFIGLLISAAYIIARETIPSYASVRSASKM